MFNLKIRKFDKEELEKQVKKLWKLVEVKRELRNVENSINQMAKLAYEYRFSMLPGAREHYEQTRNYLKVLRFYKSLLETKRDILEA